MKAPSDIPAGPFTAAMARERGISRWELDRWLEEKRIRRVLRGVYQRTNESDTQENRARAAFLVVRAFAVVCDRTAAWLHGVDTFEYRELEIQPPVETWVLRDGSRVRRRGCLGGRRDLTPADVMDLQGIRVTTPLRTALDLGCSLRPSHALAALDGFMRVHGITSAELEGALPRYRRRRGVVQLRRLIPIASAHSESPGESMTRLAIIEAGYPEPELQWWVLDRGEPVFRLDLAYPKSKVAVEYDGMAHHDSPEQRRHDERRRAWLRARGWTVIVVRKDDFEQFAREAWLAELGQALRLAA
jgi:hypothetical protein